VFRGVAANFSWNFLPPRPGRANLMLMPRLFVTAALLGITGLFLSAAASETSEARQPLTGRERWNVYFRDAFLSSGALFRAAGPALGTHLKNEPDTWGQGAAGYSRRLADRFGRFTLRDTYKAAGAALLKHEVRYIPARSSGFLPRAAHALKSNFVTHNSSGRPVPHVAGIGSAFAAEFTGNLWMPEGYGTASRALRGAGMQLGVGSAFNLVREFAPDLKRLFTGK
jgi:hypothetical protein